MKRFISVLLSFVIVCSCFSITTVNATQEEDIVSIAKSQIGYHGRPNDFTYWYGSIGGTYSYHWCAAFVSWCANQAGISTDIIPKHCSCNTGMKWFKDKGQWQDSIYQGGSYTPQAGDIVYYSDSYSQYDSTHVGIVTGTNGEYLTVVEGNTENNQVKEYTANSKRKLNSGYILGYGTPNYTPQEPEDNYVDLGTDFYAYIEHQGSGLYLTNQNTNVAGESPKGKPNQIWKFIKQSNGAYALQSNLNGYYMDVYALDEDNANVYTWSEYLNTSNQQFYIYYEYGAYYFRPAHSTTRRLDMSSTADHNLSIWGAGEDWAPQEFNIIKIDVNGNLPVDMGDEFYSYIEHQNTGLYLTNQNTNVAGETPTGNPNQIWKFIRQSNGAYALQNNLNGYYMDVYGSYDADSTNVYTWYEYTGAPNQQFYIYYKDGAHYFRPAHTSYKMLDMDLGQGNNLSIWATGNDWAPQEFNIIKIDVLKYLPITLGDNFYARIENTATHKFLSVVGNNVEGIDKNCNKQQIWNFIKQPNNSYKIINCNDLSAMDVKDYALAGSGTNIQTNVSWDTSAQLFFIYQMYESFYIKPVCTNMVLDMSQATYNLEVWDAGENWPAQKFNIEKVERDKIGTHNYTSNVTKSATCTESGIKTYICSTCGDTYTETIPATGHNVVIDDAVPPTATESGLTQGEHCGVCGKVLVTQEIIKPLGIIGDVEGDGKVTIKDSTAIQKHLANALVLDDKSLTLADANGDGIINISDSTQIQKYLVNLIEKLG